MNSNYNPPCGKCEARCCRYVAIEIERPKTKRDYDFIRWYLLHDNVNVFADHDKVWYVEFRSGCSALGEDGGCTQYSSRPDICRTHASKDGDCEFFDSPYSLRFSEAKEFETWLEGKGIDWRMKKHLEVTGENR